MYTSISVHTQLNSSPPSDVTLHNEDVTFPFQRRSFFTLKRIGVIWHSNKVTISCLVRTKLADTIEIGGLVCNAESLALDYFPVVVYFLWIVVGYNFLIAMWVLDSTPFDSDEGYSGGWDEFISV